MKTEADPEAGVFFSLPFDMLIVMFIFVLYPKYFEIVKLNPHQLNDIENP